MNLIRTPNITDVDGFYAELVDALRGHSDEQADRLMAKLVLILANHIGDGAVLSAAIESARANTLKTADAPKDLHQPATARGPASPA